MVLTIVSEIETLVPMLSSDTVLTLHDDDDGVVASDVIPWNSENVVMYFIVNVYDMRHICMKE